MISLTTQIVMQQVLLLQKQALLPVSPSPRPFSTFRTPFPSRLAPHSASTPPFLFTTNASPPSAADFALISVGLLSIYWVGNFVVPDLILKKVFDPEENEEDDTQEENMKEKLVDDEKRAIYYGLVGGTDETESDLETVRSSKSIDKGTGFGNISKKSVKGRKQKS